MVEDDEQIREGLTGSLHDAGFATLAAEDAASALAQLDAGTRVDALVTDFSMPGLNGVDLIHEVHGRWPGLPAILLTGHVSDLPAASSGKLQSEPFVLLHKPMPPARVVERLAALMAESAA